MRKPKQRNSPFTNLILNKDQSILHMLINYLNGRDLRNLRATSKTVEQILINNTTFIVKAMWTPLTILTTAIKDKQVKHFQKARMNLIPKKLNQRKFIRTILNINSTVRLQGGAGAMITTYGITKLKTNEEIYHYIKRRIRDTLILEEKIKTIIHTNGYKNPEHILKDLEKTSNLVRETQQKTMHINAAHPEFARWVGDDEYDITLFDLLHHLNNQIHLTKSMIKMREFYTNKKQYFNYKREPTENRLLTVYCTEYINNLLIEILNTIQRKTSETEEKQNITRKTWDHTDNDKTKIYTNYTNPKYKQ